MRNDKTTKRDWFFLGIFTILALVCGMLMGCRSVETTTTTKFVDGKIVEQTVVEKKDNGWILRKKGVTIHSNEFIGVIKTSTDPESGTIMPEVRVALGDHVINDIPMINDFKGEGSNYSEYLHIEKSLWGSEVSMFDYDRKSAGTGAPEPSVKINLTQPVPVAPVKPAAAPAK
jgi:hypothetical protein